MKKLRTVSYTSAELDQLPDESDWERVHNMSDEEAIANALGDPDAQPLTRERYERIKAERQRLIEAKKHKIA